MCHANLARADLRRADLRQADLMGARACLEGALYDEGTRWPAGFDAAHAAARWVPSYPAD